ncbi:hypothetical protein C2U68_15990 [Methylomonas koyamae]|nr:hypothetical protein C2U68_15990 [Methylomonas koyamae]
MPARAVRGENRLKPGGLEASALRPTLLNYVKQSIPLRHIAYFFGPNRPRNFPKITKTLFGQVLMPIWHEFWVLPAIASLGRDHEHYS